MLTIFTIPKAFEGHNKIIQRNAIRSWMKLKPECEIILFGDDVGIKETAIDLSVTHAPSIKKNGFGTPLLGSAFSDVQKMAGNAILVYVNADIIILQDLIEAVKGVQQGEFLICGRRWDLDVTYEIDFSDDEWAKKLLARLNNGGKIHGLSGIDYFIFRRGSVAMPPFAVGRPGWDGWLIGEIRRRRVPVIDATDAITVIHQNHDYSHSPFGEMNRVGGPEFAENLRLAGGLKNLMTMRDADWVLSREGVKRPPFPRRIHSLFSLLYPWRLLLAAKRNFQNIRNRR